MGTVGRTARMLRISTTLVFVLLGLGAYLLAAAVSGGTARVVLQSVGGFLLGTVVVGYAYQYFLGEETENRTVAKLDEMLGRRVDEIYPGAQRYGFSGFAKEIPRSVFDRLGAGEELLWLDTYSPDLRPRCCARKRSPRRAMRSRAFARTPETSSRCWPNSFDTVHIRWSNTPTGMLSGFQRYFERKWRRAEPLSVVT